MKRIIVDVEGRTEHYALKGTTFHIDRRLERVGENIRLDRTYTDHPTISAVRTLIMPGWNLWVMFWDGHGEPHEVNCYMHMAQVRDEGNTITIEDLYLDVIVFQDGRWVVADIDEFRAAIAAGELSQEQILAALDGMERACRLVRLAGTEIEEHLIAQLPV